MRRVLARLWLIAVAVAALTVIVSCNVQMARAAIHGDEMAQIAYGFGLAVVGLVVTARCINVLSK